MMDVESYNKSFEEIVDTFDEEADNRLRSIRQQCIRDFINRQNKRQKEWEATFFELLKKSQEGELTKPINSNTSLTSNFRTDPNNVNHSGDASNIPLGQKPVELDHKLDLRPNLENQPKIGQKPKNELQSKPTVQIKPDENQTPQQVESVIIKKTEETDDPRFSTINAMKEFVRIQELLDQSRNSFSDLNTNPSLKTFKNDLTLLIRTQINTISNSDQQHLNDKIRLLCNLFMGREINFQDRLIGASLHPQGQLFSMDLAAQTFVTVGTRLVNSVPAIASSMATVINGVVNSNLSIFKDLVTGHIQERCPYLIPMQPKLEKMSTTGNDQEVNFKIACGYSYDAKTKSLESEEKYLARIRSLALIYACILIDGHINEAWSWLAAFLSQRPQPVISATILQAFLQESSKKLSTVYGRQYKKLLEFIKNDYVKAIEEVTPVKADRQSFVKLKNLLSNDSNLIAAPTVSSIFGSIRFAR